MINYSTYMWKSPLDETAKEQAYAKNQVTKVMSFDDFVKHISDHKRNRCQSLEEAVRHSEYDQPNIDGSRCR